MTMRDAGEVPDVEAFFDIAGLERGPFQQRALGADGSVTDWEAPLPHVYGALMEEFPARAEKKHARAQLK